MGLHGNFKRDFKEFKEEFKEDFKGEESEPYLVHREASYYVMYKSFYLCLL